MTLPGASADGDGNQPAVPEKAVLKYPNLGSSLDQLVARVEEGEASAKEAAEDTPVRREGSVAVTVLPVRERGRRGELPERQRRLAPQHDARLHRSLRAGVTARSGLGRPGVIRVREIIPPEPSRSDRLVTG